MHINFKNEVKRGCSVVSDSAIPFTVALQAPLSMAFSRQEYWSGLPCPSPGDLPDPGIKLASPAAPTLQANSLWRSHWGSPIFPHSTPNSLANIISSILLILNQTILHEFYFDHFNHYHDSPEPLLSSLPVTYLILC